MIHTKQGSFEDYDPEMELQFRITEYFRKNPEVEPWRNDLKFKLIGKTLSVDDSVLPKEVKSLVRSRGF